MRGGKEEKGGASHWCYLLWSWGGVWGRGGVAYVTYAPNHLLLLLTQDLTTDHRMNSSGPALTYYTDYFHKDADEFSTDPI